MHVINFLKILVLVKQRWKKRSCWRWTLPRMFFSRQEANPSPTDIWHPWWFPTLYTAFVLVQGTFCLFIMWNMSRARLCTIKCWGLRTYVIPLFIVFKLLNTIQCSHTQNQQYHVRSCPWHIFCMHAMHACPQCSLCKPHLCLRLFFPSALSKFVLYF